MRRFTLPELTQRILSGLVLIAVALLTAWSGGLISVITFLVLGLLVLDEWESLTGTRAPRRLIMGTLIVSFTAFAAHYLGPLSALAMAAGLLFLALGAALLESPRRWFLTGVAYAAWLVASLISLRGHDAIGLTALLFVFVAVWSTDIAAYFGGLTIGGPKLSPMISPNKTWAGAISGAIAAIALCLAFLVWARTSDWDIGLAAISGGRGVGLSMTAVAFVALIAFALSFAAQVGDLFESALKRKFGVKDSGSLLPGHGGFMDRVDGLVFASAAAFLIGLALRGEGTVAEGFFAFAVG
ncbi:MAG: phosphatidate cytidylyltransferase [Cohaesibacteraceae bacterium]